IKLHRSFLAISTIKKFVKRGFQICNTLSNENFFKTFSEISIAFMEQFFLVNVTLPRKWVEEPEGRLCPLNPVQAIMSNITSKFGLTELWYPKVLKQPCQLSEENKDFNLQLGVERGKSPSSSAQDAK
ncbi:hypothetical protein L9F63_008418, partial [Diploptera punctata]